ncbi:uncharacterized protein WCC33_016765 isoform 2-T2 [Rhinophrynus dorsalis]
MGQSEPLVFHSLSLCHAVRMSIQRLLGILTAVCLLAHLVGSQTTLLPLTSIGVPATDVNCTSVNTTRCAACPPGTFSNNVPQTVLSVSRAKQDPFPIVLLPLYALNVNQVISPPIRMPHSVSPAHADHIASTFKGTGDRACRFCRNGDYQVKWGGASCDKCPEDHYCPSPDINPIECPDDAFCPEGSTQPSYCMETFLHKAGDSCKLAPFTIVLLVIFVACLLVILLFVIRKQKRSSERNVRRVGSKSPLLEAQRSPGSVYGVSYDGAPVYAGW